MPSIYLPSLIAQITNPALGPGLQNLNGVVFFQKLLPALVGIGFVLGTIIFFFMLLIGAIQWITSGGDKAAVEAARSRVFNAIIGLVVLFAIFAIINLLEIFFATNIVRLDIGPLKVG